MSGPNTESQELPSLPEPVYPLPRTENDPRFTWGLTNEVARVLADAGFPSVVGLDHVALGQALFAFLYAAPTDDEIKAYVEQRKQALAQLDEKPEQEGDWL